jgi:transcriptional regulator with GAF, ATPase, and Fis domain
VCRSPSGAGRTKSALRNDHFPAISLSPWLGSIRDLQNVIERAIITARLGMLRFDLPIPREAPAGRIELPSLRKTEPAVVKEHEMRPRERDNIMAALRQSQGRIDGVGGAVELLGLRPTTLTARIKKFGLKKVIHRG